MKLKRILLILLIIPFFSLSQNRGSGNGSYKGSGKDNSKDYIKEEEYANKNKLGIWKGKFEEPYLFRKKRK